MEVPCSAFNPQWRVRVIVVLVSSHFQSVNAGKSSSVYECQQHSQKGQRLIIDIIPVLRRFCSFQENDPSFLLGYSSKLLIFKVMESESYYYFILSNIVNSLLHHFPFTVLNCFFLFFVLFCDKL